MKIIKEMIYRVKKPNKYRPLVLPDQRGWPTEETHFIMFLKFTEEEHDQFVEYLAEIEQTWGKIQGSYSWGATEREDDRNYGAQLYFAPEQNEAAFLTYMTFLPNIDHDMERFNERLKNRR